MSEINHIEEKIKESILLKQRVLEDRELLQRVGKAAGLLTSALEEGRKALFCGNGGSAADAQHLAAELSGKFYLDRPPLPAEACHVNSSFVTAYSNDYSFARAFARYVEAFGQEGDVLVALSTSGNSENILEAIYSARSRGMTVIGFTGMSGGMMKDLCDVLINIPSNDTPRIQELHITIGHILCEMTEKQIFG
ncbi:MAG TPA: D-sedoheptulose 7-phosphate isomerase [Prolixibacteraceae bacterium]|mgnify:CR=1 FL=1|nr:D-sedoheptulose 7-phosphate isomerase [Prolixibacteraceae bacterium]